MKNITLNLSNEKQRLIKVQEELRNLLSIIMGVITEEVQDVQSLEYFREKATSSEDVLLIQELQKSMQEIEKRAQEYHESIGITTRTTRDKTSKKNISHVSESDLNRNQSSIDMFENEIENKHHNGFDIEL